MFMFCLKNQHGRLIIPEFCNRQRRYSNEFWDNLRKKLQTPRYDFISVIVIGYLMPWIYLFVCVTSCSLPGQIIRSGFYILSENNAHSFNLSVKPHVASRVNTFPIFHICWLTSFENGTISTRYINSYFYFSIDRITSIDLWKVPRSCFSLNLIRINLYSP